ncbi:MAG: phospho-N-acetylmuramoyl-pentapeptide-transferase [Clostridiales bacterium]|nr:phospho-N-acetylmuramoyl-pentapeptide-transferase [Clostridiales bacterium]
MTTLSVWLPMVIFALAVFALTVLAGFFGLPLLRRLRVGQIVRDDGPKSHFSKSGTPTFGGLFFLAPLFLLAIAAFLLEIIPDQAGVLILLMLLFGAVGFVDDYIKVRVSKKGLSVRQKTVLLLLISIAFSVYYLYLAPEPAVFLLPLTGQALPISGWFRLPYLVFVVLVLFFTSNSVNLTDGVDGLASSVTAVSGVGFFLAAFLIQPMTQAVQAGALTALAMTGACLAFLVFNRHPARVFMGDTGSQALGAGIAGVALLYGAPWLILLIGVIYMVESMSVIIQVIYFRKTGGKRIFRMSPIHHHYELGGWPEVKIVRVFTLTAAVGTIIGLLLLL